MGYLDEKIQKIWGIAWKGKLSEKNIKKYTGDINTINMQPNTITKNYESQYPTHAITTL